MQKQTVVRLARKKTGSIESTLEGILLNEVLLSSLDCIEQKKWYQWINNGTILLWCDKVSECINLTSLDTHMKSLSKVLNFSSFSFCNLLSHNKILLQVSIIGTIEEKSQNILDRYYDEISKLSTVVHLSARNIIIPEINYYEFEAKLILFF